MNLLLVGGSGRYARNAGTKSLLRVRRGAVFTLMPFYFVSSGGGEGCEGCEMVMDRRYLGLT